MTVTIMFENYRHYVLVETNILVARDLWNIQRICSVR